MSSSRNEENILYECLVFSEWPQEPELLQGKLHADNSLSSASPFNLLKSWRKASGFPETLVPFRSKHIGWSFSIDITGKLIAVLQTQFIEIRSKRDDFATVIGKAKIDKDPHPQWQVIRWSDDATMLAYANSSGNIQVFDVVGTNLFNLSIAGNATNTRLLSVTSTNTVAAIIIIPDRTDTSDSRYEILVIYHSGILQSFCVSSTENHGFAHSFSFSKYYPQGVTSVAHHPNHQMLLVSGPLNVSCTVTSNESEAKKNPMSFGLTLWRLLNDAPHYKLITSLSEDILLTGNSWKFPYFSLYGKTNKNVVSLVSISPNGRLAATLHTDGALSLWDFPSLQPKKFWALVDQPSYNEVNPNTPHSAEYKSSQNNCSIPDGQYNNFLVDINWWSDEELVLARASGAVCVSSVDSLKNLLGNSSEWLEPMPLVSAATNGNLFALECENQISKKRRLVSDLSVNNEQRDEDSWSSSDDEDVGVVTKSKRSVSKLLYYVTDSDRFQPPRKKPKILTKTYRLICIKSTTPEELFSYKLDCEEYGEALSLARNYGLDCDLVYQRQWRKSVVCVSSIQDYLSKITKRSWVLHECLERVPENIDAAKELLLYGLRGTDLPALISIGKGEDKGKFILCERHTLYEDDVEHHSVYVDPEELMRQKVEKERQAISKLMEQVDFTNLTLEQRQLIHCRSRILNYLDRLSTYEVILGGVHAAEDRFDSKFYNEFRTKSALKCAVDFARQSDWRAVEAMFTFHSDNTLPYRLTILSNFPETTSPFQYQVLLPECELNECDRQVFDWQTDRWRDLDWSEDDQCSSYLDVHTHQEISAADDDDDILISDFDAKNLTPKILHDWYKHRACDIESRSYQVDNALELVKLGMEKNIPELEMLYDDLVTMETLVYECLIGPEITFIGFCKLSELEKLELLMSSSSEEDFLKYFERWAVPFLQRFQKKEKEGASCILKEYLTFLASEKLHLCLEIFEAAQQPGELSILCSNETLLEAAVRCLMAYQRSEQLEYATSIFRCLPRSYRKKNPNLQKELDEIENCLIVAEIFESHKIPLTVQQIMKMKVDPGMIIESMRKLTRQETRDSNSGELEWRQILYDVLEMQSKLFTQIPEEQCFQIFTESLLCSGNKSNISLAGHLINTSPNKSKPPVMSTLNNPLYYKRVDYKDGILLIINAAKEYFNSAANMQDSCMDLARACLDLIIGKNDEIQEELDLISSLNYLSDFNVNILPVQVRLCEDRIDLIEMAMSSSTSAYQNSQKLLKLAHLLRVNKNDAKSCEGRVLHLIAEAALQVKDFDRCWKTCIRIIEIGYNEGWCICEKLGLCEDFYNLSVRCDMLSYSLCYCPDDRIQTLLDMRGLLEVEILSNKMEVNIAIPETESKLQEFSLNSKASSTVKQMLQATSKTSKAILNTVTCQEFWKNTSKWVGLNNDVSDEAKIDTLTLTLAKQGVAEYFSSLFSDYECSQIDADYSGYSINYENSSLVWAQMLLRLSLLDYTLSQGEIQSLNAQIILAVAKHILPHDTTSGLSLLLALPKPSDAESYLEKLSKTDITLQLITYYYSLQLHQMLQAPIDEVYLYDANQMIAATPDLLNSGNVDTEEMQKCSRLFREYYDCLTDFVQGQALNKLNFGLDISRFTSDPVYKQETILGLSMTTCDNVYDIALSLAHRYKISLWKFYSTHLLYLFSETSITRTELEKRVAGSAMLDVLLEDKVGFRGHLLNAVNPSISGNDLQRLLFMFTLLEKCGDDEEVASMKPSQHIKIIRKLVNIMPEVNYRNLTEGSVTVLDVIRPHLHKENLVATIKLAPKIPDKNGGYLDSSSIFGLWSSILFFKEKDKPSKQSKSNEYWYHQFNNGKEFMVKLKPADLLNYINNIIFIDQSLDKMPMECRVEILKRAIKFVMQHSAKTTGDTREKWQEVIDNLRWNVTHLGLMQTEPIKSFTQSQDPVLKGYARQFDISRSQEEQLKGLLIKTIVDNQPPSLLNDLLSMCHSIGLAWNVNMIYEEAITHVLLLLRVDPDCLIGSLKKSPLITFKSILERNKKISKNIDVVALVRPFCNDQDVSIKTRFYVLQQLDKLYKLDEHTKESMILLQTMLLLHDSWPNVQISVDDVTSLEARHSLLARMLAESQTLDALVSLCKLLEAWPPLTSPPNINDNQWLLILTKMINMNTRNALDQAITYVRVHHQTCIMPEQVVVYLVGIIEKQHSPLHLMKICLLSEDADVQQKAVVQAKQLKEVTDDVCDEELLRLILKRRLLRHFVVSILYEPAVDWLLSNQLALNEDSSFLSVDSIISDLQVGGYETEAGSLSLRLRGAHHGLINFNTAYSFSKLFKTS